MTVSIRNAEISDVDKIVELEKACFDAPACEPRKVHKERVEVFGSGFLVMEEGDDFVGMISSEIWQIEDEPCNSSFTLGHSISEVHNEDGNELYLSNFGVFPKYRGKGYGKILFNTLLSRMKETYPNLKEATLIVSEDWETARCIYLKKGFNVNRVIPNFFDADNGKHDGLIMKKEL